MDDDLPYLLLTPGPLTTSPTVKQVMLRDWCTWDRDYHRLVNDIRQQLVQLAAGAEDFTAVLMQGSGTFAVESVIGSVIPPAGRLLVAENGAYGRRMAEIAHRLRIDHVVLPQPETRPIEPGLIEEQLAADCSLTHVGVVHCETTSGLLNPAAEVGRLCRRYGRVFLLDAMSSFGGLPLDIQALGADYLVSSANKCLQGVPGFALVIARRADLERTRGWSRSLSLDLFDQWQEMETHGGKWRFTSPTHVVRAFAQALAELDAEGGISARARRYAENHRLLVEGMARLGILTLVAPEHQSPIITSFLYPNDARFEFPAFYEAMKRRRFVLYPGKITQADTFRVGTIGHVFPADIRALLAAVAESLAELRCPDALRPPAPSG